MLHVSGVWLIVLAVAALVSLALVVWAVTDVLRRPAWQFPPARKALWTITLGLGWLLGLYPVVAVSSVLYLAVLRRRLPSASASVPAAGPVATPVAAPTTPPVLPPAGWYPDPAGTPGERWWDGLGWTDHQRPYDA